MGKAAVVVVIMQTSSYCTVTTPGSGRQCRTRRRTQLHRRDLIHSNPDLTACLCHCNTNHKLILHITSYSLLWFQPRDLTSIHRGTERSIQCSHLPVLAVTWRSCFIYYTDKNYNSQNETEECLALLDLVVFVLSRSFSQPPVFMVYSCYAGRWLLLYITKSPVSFKQTKSHLQYCAKVLYLIIFICLLSCLRQCQNLVFYVVISCMSHVLIKCLHLFVIFLINYKEMRASLRLLRSTICYFK